MFKTKLQKKVFFISYLLIILGFVIWTIVEQDNFWFCFVSIPIGFFYSMIALYITRGIEFFVKSSQEPDVKAASELRMTVGRYRKYREIFDEQVKCYEEGKTPPNRINEIPNMNEWKRYGEFRERYFHDEVMRTIQKLNGGK